MKKKFIAGGMTLVMVGVLLAGCGVPQEDLDAAEAARDAAQAEVASLEADLAAAEAEVASLEADVTTAEAAVTAAEAATASVQADLDDAESDLAAANSAKATAQSALSTARSDLAAAESDLADALVTIAELEAAAAPAEEEAADDADAAPAAGGTAPTTFTYETYTDDTYGFTIAYEASWVDDVDYGSYKVWGGVPWAVPSLTMNPVGYENTESGTVVEASDDYEATLMAGASFGSMISVNPGTLANGTEVTIYIYEVLGDYPATNAGMYVDINGTDFIFTVSQQAALSWYQVDDYATSAIELLLSLDF